MTDDVLKISKAETFPKLLESPNYLDTNVALYTARVTTKEYLKDLNPES